MPLQPVTSQIPHAASNSERTTGDPHETHQHLSQRPPTHPPRPHELLPRSRVQRLHPHRHHHRRLRKDILAAAHLPSPRPHPPHPSHPRPRRPRRLRRRPRPPRPRALRRCRRHSPRRRHLRSRRPPPPSPTRQVPRPRRAAQAPGSKIKGSLPAPAPNPPTPSPTANSTAPLRCIATPGHTPGHFSFLDERDGILYAGDALVTMADTPTLPAGPPGTSLYPTSPPGTALPPAQASSACSTRTSPPHHPHRRRTRRSSNRRHRTPPSRPQRGQTLAIALLLLFFLSSRRGSAVVLAHPPYSLLTKTHTPPSPETPHPLNLPSPSNDAIEGSGTAPSNRL